MTHLPPHSIETEEAVLACCFISQDAFRTARDIVAPADFYKPSHQTLFDAMCRVDRTDRLDVVTVSEVLTRSGQLDDVGGFDTVAQIAVAVIPMVSNVRRYATTVAQFAQHRRLMMSTGEAVAAATGPDDLLSRLAHITRDPASGGVSVDDDGDDYMDDWDSLLPTESRDEAQPWIFRGVLRMMQRLLIVAPAGSGKSWLMRMLAVCAQNGIHPWTTAGIPEVNASILELEASKPDIKYSIEYIVGSVARMVGCDPRDLKPPSVWRRTGLTVRDPKHRFKLERWLDKSPPGLLVAGPIKFMGDPRPGEGYDVHATAMMLEWNRLVMEFGFGLIMEAHSNRSEPDKPGGSQRWIDWPDVGFTLLDPLDEGGRKPKVRRNPKERMEFNVDPFRLPRDGDVVIPETLIRKAYGDRTGLPWAAGSASHTGTGPYGPTGPYATTTDTF